MEVNVCQKVAMNEEKVKAVSSMQNGAGRLKIEAERPAMQAWEVAEKARHRLSEGPLRASPSPPS